MFWNRFFNRMVLLLCIVHVQLIICHQLIICCNMEPILIWKMRFVDISHDQQICSYWIHLFLLQMGRTSLHVAVEEGRLSVIEYLVSNGADFNTNDFVSCCFLQLFLHNFRADLYMFYVPCTVSSDCMALCYFLWSPFNSTILHIKRSWCELPNWGLFVLFFFWEFWNGYCFYFATFLLIVVNAM